ncbi:MAG TPA: response regulator [Bryobacteraceae bacterium]|nr:response regulator [Bryobacteraceae bacterium]
MPQRTAAILLLSSEPVVRHILTEVLEKSGYVVRPAADLGAAVDLLDRSPMDLLIVRTYIEGIPGHQAAKYLHERCPSMGTLIVSGLPADDRVFVRAEVEHFDIFPAPFTAEELVATVDRVLENRKAASALKRSSNAGAAPGSTR